jgi:Protein of unknown function (DUF3298)
MDRKLEKMKKDYLNIPIPNELEKQTHKSIKRYRTLRSVSKNAIFLAASILLFITTVNISPAAASTLSDIPFLNKVIKVVTITEWKETKENNQLDIKTPEVTGLENKTLSQTLNQQYVQESKELYSKFQQETANENGNYSLESGYIVKTDDDLLLSLGRYTVETKASAAESIHYDTIDKQNELLITLPSLFKDDSYIDAISSYILHEMNKQMKADTGSYFIKSDTDPEGFDKIDPHQNFYINKQHKLVICFNEYEVAPGYMGTVEFLVPSEVIKDYLVSDLYIR